MTDPAFDGKAFCRRLPGRPGVYRMLAEDGSVLYVGKARNLKKRVGSYFSRSSRDPRIEAMVTQIAGIEISVTRTEGEALLLEDELIKSLKPRYNVLLRDDKSYPFIYLASEHEFPRLGFHRGPQRQPGEYFGPFPSAYAVRDSLNQMQKIFRVRQCEDTFFRNRSRPCLQYQIKRCTAPCVGRISREDYAEDVRHARMFLEGGAEKVIGELVERMERASEALEFEKAAELRDQIVTLQKIQAQQFVAGAQGDLDVVAAATDGQQACVQVLFFRQGRNLGNRAFYPRLPAPDQPAAVLRAFMSQHYLRREIPRQILIGEDLEDRELLEEVFSERAGHRVRIVAHPRGDRAKWLEMAQRNAKTALATSLASHSGLRKRLQDLQDLLDLDELPARMECFDVSHTRGEKTVASCVVFDENGPVKSDYRRFNIRDVAAGDDYGAMRQALERRYRRLKSGEGKMPDLLLIDGGKGQLRQALETLDELQIDEIHVVAVAKGERRREGEETLISGAARKTLKPGSGSPGLRLIQWIRDEAHRFAITGHRQRRSKARRRSVLEDVPGIGPKRRRALLTHFGGLRGLAAAGVEELSTVEGISRELARRIYAVLHDD
ncbi:MAG: excinuclease ABC subunit UvrC [Xanthomonadales bacterium]|nr:excinuclease ABC subunit UvrC [Xanthomonadales bacterium]